MLYVCITFTELKRLDILRRDKLLRTSCIKIDTALKKRRPIGRQLEETKRETAEHLYGAKLIRRKARFCRTRISLR